MCLIIDSTKHKKLFGFYLPKIAWKDIPVYKLLDHSCPSQIKTPWRDYPIIFHESNVVLKSTLSYYHEEIHKGIHAYRKKIPSFPYSRFHKAIIPRGSLYYIGMHLDIVSTKLIIFENDKNI